MLRRSGRSNAADPADIGGRSDDADDYDDDDSLIMPLAVSSVGFVGLGLLYVVLFVVLGITSIRKGHWIMFLIGIFIPIFWIIGALMPPTRPSE
jgi:hypothetical protein